MRERVHELVRGARASIEANRRHIDDLNVYPVPDGDTGTNLTLTLRAVDEALDREGPDDRAGLAKEVARAALMGARGNSGVILSQIVRGAADALAETDDLALVFRAASDAAYRAVKKPVEGTMLTAIRSMADAAEHGGDLRTIIARGDDTRPADTRAAAGAARGGRRRRRRRRADGDRARRRRRPVGRRAAGARGARARSGRRRDPPGALALSLLHRLRGRGRRARLRRARGRAGAVRRLAARRGRLDRAEGARAHGRSRPGAPARCGPRRDRRRRDRQHARPDAAARGSAPARGAGGGRHVRGGRRRLGRR